MKYWVFQNNQVIGPYEPDDLGRLVAFTPESLVCPEGRKGTSMGDWQRAGMVPDLSVALVKSSQRQPARGGLATLAGLPPEPTLKDLAVLGSIQEKVATLEDVAAQLQESLRVKEAELNAVHGALADKDREAAAFREEAERQRQESEQLKEKLAALERRLSGVNNLSQTLDKAVESERQVQDEVQKHGETLAALGRELEELRRRLENRPPEAGARAAAAPALETPAPLSKETSPPELSAPPPPLPDELSAPEPKPLEAGPGVAAFEIGSPAPSPETVSPIPFDRPGLQTIDPFPGGRPPANDLLLSAEPFPMPTPQPAGPASAPQVFGMEQGATDLKAADLAAPKPRRGKALALAAVGVLALGAAAFLGGFIPGLPAPASEPAAGAAPAPSLEPASAPPAEAPAGDPRQEAVATAKAWPVPGGMSLGEKLDLVAPASGSLSPWMAETLPDGRVQVNYFASGAAAGSPTIAYEFVVDLGRRALSGRNAAAKSILAGRAPAPPKPARARPVRVKPKRAAKAPRPAPAAPADDADLDIVLGGAKPAPRTAAIPVRGPAPGGVPLPGGMAPAPAKAAGEGEDDVESLLMPGFNEKGSAKAPAPQAKRGARPRRAAPAPEPEPAPAGAADEAMLDDLLED